MAENPLFDDLNKRAEQEPAPTTDIVEQPQKQLVSEQELSQIRQRQEQLKQQPQVQQLAEKIDVKNQIAVLEFGKETAQGISTFSDRMLATIKQSNLEKSTTLLNNLNKIMDRFDPQDFQEEQKKGFLKKLFSKSKEQLERILSKYDTMNKEVDVVYNEIQKYEVEMKQNTVQLEQMYDENLNYFHTLSEHIAAIDIKVNDLRQQLPALSAKADSGDHEAIMELETVTRGIELLEQRGYDLEMAQQVSFQSAPQIRLMQQGNNHLIGKINSAFVTTIPIFKQGLIHAVTMQRQKLVSDSMAELDRRTNEMLVRNAENVRQNSVNIARQAGSPSIKVETIETTWKTIISGIEETKQIQAETVRNREEGRKRIEQLQLEYEKLKSM
ncbi:MULTISPECIES: toxic anion resistance protein [Solibacillus]|uniref:toxic anion resistance protein n=1 Tax=Solibacillus TaxID=648800 RepID=UPI00203F779A|nr:toxic anion resistance protein [Solibacillus isronensis]MCM3721538.1 toxic anion resistance protein [Solibacillus isronensis]